MEIFKSQDSNDGFETMGQQEAEHFGGNSNYTNFQSNEDTSTSTNEGTHEIEGTNSLYDNGNDYGSFSQPADLSFLDFADIYIMPDEDLTKKMNEAVKNKDTMTAYNSKNAGDLSKYNLDIVENMHKFGMISDEEYNGEMKERGLLKEEKKQPNKEEKKQPNKEEATPDIDEDTYEFAKNQLTPMIDESIGQPLNRYDHQVYDSDFGFELDQALQELTNEKKLLDKSKSMYDIAKKKYEDFINSDEYEMYSEMFGDSFQAYGAPEDPGTFEEFSKRYVNDYNKAKAKVDKLLEQEKQYQDIIKAYENKNKKVEEPKVVEENKIVFRDEQKAETYSIPKENSASVTKQLDKLINEIRNSKIDYSGSYTIEIDPTDATTEKDGTHTPLSSYMVNIYKGKRIAGAGTYDDIVVISPKGEYVLYGKMQPPTGWSNGLYEFYKVSGKDAKTIKNQATRENLVASSPSGGVTSSFNRDFTKAIQKAVEKDYVEYRNERNTPKKEIVQEQPKKEIEQPKEEIEQPEKIIDVKNPTEDTIFDIAKDKSIPVDDRAAAIYKIAEKHYFDPPYDKLLEDVRNEQAKANHDKAQQMADEATEKYKKGELTDVQYSNILTRAKRLDPYISFMDLNELKREQRQFKEDIVNTETEVGKRVDTQIKRLLETAQKVEDIKVEDVTIDTIEQVKNDLIDATHKLYNDAQVSIDDLIKELRAQGKDIQKIKDSEDFRNLSSEVFKIAQNIKDKSNQIRLKADQLGYTKTKKLDQKVKNFAISAVEKIDDFFNEPGENWKITDQLTKDEAYAINAFLNDIDSVEYAAESLMKSAAFNGAENVTGEEYSEAWKNEKAYKPKLLDILANASSGSLGLYTMLTAIPMIATNPIAGIALLAAGSLVTGANIGHGIGKIGLANISNKEQMFGTGNKAKDIAIDVYNRGWEEANYGDPRSVGTYTESIGAGLQLGGALLEIMTNPVAAAPKISQALNRAKNLRQGSEAGVDTLNKNIYSLLKHYDDFNNTEFAEDFLENEDFDIESYTEDEVAGDYGIESEGLTGDDKYSGYIEQAKDKNLALDYNRGLEKEANEVVSDKYCKLFRTILDKEPNYIRKVLIAIPKMHSEAEW